MGYSFGENLRCRTRKPPIVIFSNWDIVHNSCQRECKDRNLEDILCLKKSEICASVLGRGAAKRECANKCTFDDQTETLMIAEIQDQYKAEKGYEPWVFTQWVLQEFHIEVSGGFEQSFRDIHWRDIQQCIVRPREHTRFNATHEDVDRCHAELDEHVVGYDVNLIFHIVAVKIFLKHLQEIRQDPSIKAVSLIDNLRAHNLLKAQQIYKDNNIKTISVQRNWTYALQSLDLSTFHDLKTILKNTNTELTEGTQAQRIQAISNATEDASQCKKYYKK
ncbi:MAG: hypothetical protein EZS28_030525 [Streblomastix strix]|uniref:DDE-1 domain-containing protein n=1 Tax=Streblomastix strix TaxID=222440 RepID=A0A5J4UU69_9EUKA|nr:MAG: hypothetical protein EZS28_030525 [Streblomastix strix]